MNVNGKKLTSLWIENNSVMIIDQTKLPFLVSIKELKTKQDFLNAINRMEVRGAPLIGVTAAFGFAFALKKNATRKNIDEVYSQFFNTRPTAVNLKWAIDKIKDSIINLGQNQRFDVAFKKAEEIRDYDISSCLNIAQNGYKIIKKLYEKKKRKLNILTHCNAGWLATVDWGTALAPIFLAKKQKIPIHIWVDETRPRNQGALLTAWELENEQIPYTVIADNAGGHLMQNKKIDLCIVGSDRTAMNGDVCNKIGTYLKAISAFINNIPFYVALPSSTIDKTARSGNCIPIEERSSEELTHINVFNGSRYSYKQIYLNCKKVHNPAFDITPSKYVTQLITDKGNCRANLKSIQEVLKT
tara:strand:+ start:457 stop:1527 length:1071 start_codon:yes stop_codon:yes gene_type:complete